MTLLRKLRMTQHPVGQGGMMSGTFEVYSGSKFHWVYDCGSDHIKDLEREIHKVSLCGVVDVLFLSHLDSDHINGVDRLISKVSVKEVVLPYLNDLDKFVIAASDIS